MSTVVEEYLSKSHPENPIFALFGPYFFRNLGVMFQNPPATRNQPVRGADKGPFINYVTMPAAQECSRVHAPTLSIRAFLWRKTVRIHSAIGTHVGHTGAAGCPVTFKNYVIPL